MPLRVEKHVPGAHPALTYAAAVRRIAALQARDRREASPLACLHFRTHGEKVARAIILLHGYTNSPPQFGKLGEIFFDLGYNVLIPRAPHHGLADRLCTDHARLTVQELTALADEAIAIGRGLGRHVTVAGLSMGGVMAAWAAQERAEVDRAVLIAPCFGFRGLPAAVTPLAAFLAARLPNIFIWWDPRLRGDAPGPPYAYPRYASRALANILRLSALVQARARQCRPAARSVVVVTNTSDQAVDNAATARVVACWRRLGAEDLSTYEFPAELGLPHDLIDPSQPNQRIDIVYPVLVKLIAGQEAAG